MLQGRTLLVRTAALAGAGAAGGALALGGASLAGGVGGTTVREIHRVTVSTGGSRKPSSAGSSTAPTIAQVFRRDAPGVVQLASATSTLGSGFVVDKAGHLITSMRVVRAPGPVLVSFSNADRLPASVVGRDPASGVVVLQLRTRSRALEPLPLGSSSTLAVGAPVLALANRSGYARTVTAGIVNGFDRRAAYADDELIRTDASTGRATAGGPIVDLLGRVVGVDSGDGLAIPIDTVKQVAAQLIAGGTVERATLGVSVAPVDRRLARLFNLPAAGGLLVQRVEPGGAADRAGVRGGTTRVVVSGESFTLGGDLLVRADGTPLPSRAALRTLLARKRPGDRVALELYRGTSRLTLHPELGRQPPAPG